MSEMRMHETYRVESVRFRMIGRPRVRISRDRVREGIETEVTMPEELAVALAEQLSAGRSPKVTLTITMNEGAER